MLPAWAPLALPSALALAPLPRSALACASWPRGPPWLPRRATLQGRPLCASCPRPGRPFPWGAPSDGADAVSASPAAACCALLAARACTRAAPFRPSASHPARPRPAARLSLGIISSGKAPWCRVSAKDTEARAEYWGDGATVACSQQMREEAARAPWATKPCLGAPATCASRPRRYPAACCAAGARDSGRPTQRRVLQHPLLQGPRLPAEKRACRGLLRRLNHANPLADKLFLGLNKLGGHPRPPMLVVHQKPEKPSGILLTEHQVLHKVAEVSCFT